MTLPRYSCSYLCWANPLWVLLKPLFCCGNNSQGWSYPRSVIHSSRSHSAHSCSSFPPLPSLSVPSFTLRSPMHVRVSTLQREKGKLGRGEGREQYLSLTALTNYWIGSNRPKLNPSTDKAEAFKQPQCILNQLQCFLHRWNSHLTYIPSKKFVLRDFFCLVKMLCK